MLIYVAPEETRMPAMLAFADPDGNIYINGARVPESEMLARDGLGGQLKPIQMRVDRSKDCSECEYLREERDRICAAINWGHGR